MVLLGMAPGATMREEMGTFRVDVEIENPARPGQRRTVRSVLVDTGAELSWIPAEKQAVFTASAIPTLIFLLIKTAI